jgi:hypothetical protein
MQIFVDAFINQCRRHQVPAELILVEWNPPEGQPKLAEALAWPAITHPCEVRIIEVGPELHRRYRHAAALPLYQMIAKNAGIRRARGEFILATNIDVILSDELMHFIASRRLQKGRLYRVDRTDVGAEVPADGTLDEQLKYCRSHIIRVCARDGVFRLTPDGFREREPDDITPPDSGIYLGEGWCEPERYTVDRFRWMRDEAEIFLRVPASGGLLEFEIEAGPGVGPPPHPLEVLHSDGAPIAEWNINGRTSIRLMVPARPDGGIQTIRFRSPTGGWPVPGNPRIMNFRFFRCAWVDPKTSSNEVQPLLQTVRAERPALSRLVRAELGGGLRFLAGAPAVVPNSIRLLQMRHGDIFDGGVEFEIDAGWHYLESNSAERYRWVSNRAGIFLRFFDGSSSVAMLVEPGPSAGYKPFDLVARSRGGEVLGKAQIRGMTYVEFPVPAKPDQLFYLQLDAENITGASIPVPGDARTMTFRVLAFGRGTSRSGRPAPNSQSVEVPWRFRKVKTRPPDVDWQEHLKGSEAEIAGMGRQPSLHLTACGDFQMMSREDWANIRGYAELDQFSLHLDSLLSYCAAPLGITEEILEAPMRVYHVEHDVGTGWTPEGHKQLAERLAQRRIPMVLFEDLSDMVAQMRQRGAPMIFNLDDWGLAALDLPETNPAVRAQSAAS